MTTEQISQLILAIFGSAATSTIVGYLFQRRKNNADTESVAVKTAIGLVDSLRVRVGELDDQVYQCMEAKEELKAEVSQVSDNYAIRIGSLERDIREKDIAIKELADRVKRLEAQLVSEGFTPKP